MNLIHLLTTFKIKEDRGTINLQKVFALGTVPRSYENKQLLTDSSLEKEA
jgi:hypothetical protein